jgi:hypothetical protein
MLTSCFLVAVFSAGAAGAETAAPAGSGSEASVAYRNETTKRFEAPSETTVREMAARAGAEAPAALAVDELAALGLREEAVAVRAGGVKLRLRGGLRSALLAEEREARIVLTCEGAPAAATDSPEPASGDGGETAEVRP